MAPQHTRTTGKTPAEEKPPFLGNWPRVYALVIAVLLVEILLLWLFTNAYR